jgi:hypothetical protein
MQAQSTTVREGPRHVRQNFVADHDAYDGCVGEGELKDRVGSRTAPVGENRDAAPLVGKNVKGNTSVVTWSVIWGTRYLMYIHAVQRLHAVAARPSIADAFRFTTRSRWLARAKSGTCATRHTRRCAGDPGCRRGRSVLSLIITRRGSICAGAVESWPQCRHNQPPFERAE